MGPADGPSEVLITRRRTSPLFAAMVNAAAAHVVEQDDVHNGSVFHPAAVVFPPALAVAQALGSSGRDLITAAVAGYEVGIRVGEFLGRSHYKIFHTTGTAGTLAAAVTTGHLLKLSPEQMLHALGAAGTQAAGLWEFLRDAADSKQLHTAKAAAAGITAAYLAREGFTGARHILEGPQGMAAGMSTDADPSKLCDRLGQRWALAETSFKFHASCRHTHPAADALQQALRDNNVQAAPGQAKGLYVVSNIQVNTDLVNVAEFRDLVVKRDGDAIVRLGDVATVELGAASTDSSGLMDGEPAVYFGLNATPVGNPLVIVKRLNELVPNIKQNLPPGTSVQVPFELARFISASIDGVMQTLLEAGAIVVVVIFLCLGSLRAVLIPVITIPLSMLGGAAIMALFGFSVNLLTLLAMVLAIGLVVDDAIVVVENVHRHIEEGKSPVRAALIGAREVAGPVIAMTITLAAGYAPIGLMGGLTGSLFKEFAFTLAGAVVVSGVIALTLSPVMSSFLLNSHVSEGWMAQRAARFFGRLGDAYGRVLDVSLHHRWVTGLIAVAVLISLPFLRPC
ncbi:hypothetical protein G6F68_009816 [Rhizopus microsporus]|nr:hypothetical protein G6F68_009816 [Rhizopus microsporus]